nr:MAG TPA: hypothetical protein [Herelleviridae sp.]
MKGDTNMICDCYHSLPNNEGECWGTKERDRCYCNGDGRYCPYYPEKRNSAIDAKRKNENMSKDMSKEKSALNTAEMWLKAQKNGKTYVSDCAMYSKAAGYVGRISRDTAWGLEAWTSVGNEDKKRELDRLMSAKWYEEVPTMSRAEAESRLGVKIVD